MKFDRYLMAAALVGVLFSAATQAQEQEDENDDGDSAITGRPIR